MINAILKPIITSDKDTGLKKTTILSFKSWSELIEKNFEKHFYVSETKSPEDSKMINRRGIYKDSVNASQEWADYQFRPNFAIAMCVVSIFGIVIQNCP